MSLAGRGIVVTRPRQLAEVLAASLESRGARAIVFPAIEIEALPPPDALRRLGDYTAVVFVSPSAVRIGMRAIGAWPAGVVAAAIGAGTRRELERCGVGSVVSPAAGADSEALLATPQMQDVAGKCILIVRGEGGRPFLGEALATRGARVEYAESYRRRRPNADARALLELWGSGAVHAVSLSSTEGVDNFRAMVGDAGARLFLATPAFVPHARVASHVRPHAREVVVAGPGDDELVERLVAYFHDRT